MNNFKYIFFVLALSSMVQTQAQQDPHFSLYRYNMSIINPAFSGSEDNVEAIFSGKSQWVDIEGSPDIFHFNVNSPFGQNIGLGLNIVSDQVFVLQETHVYADFSYKLKLSEQLNLYAGLKAGGTFLNIDLNELNIVNDPLFSQNVSGFNPNIGLGFYLKSDKYFISLSAPAVLKNDRYEKEGSVPVEASDDSAIFLGGGYNFQLTEEFKLKPSIFTRAVKGAPVSADFTVSGLYNERFELGGNYRIEESITFFATVAFMNNNAVSLGYAYEHTTSDIGNYNAGSHEFILKFRL